jgi:Fic family protein
MASITPFILQDKAPGELQNDVVELLRLDAALNYSIPAPLRAPMTHLLRIVNSYYSNRIEGNPTLPSDVLHAQEDRKESSDSADLLEMKHHIEVQTSLANRTIASDEVCSSEFLKHIHREFYRQLTDEHLIIRHSDTGEVVRLMPGEFRTRTVKVGKHVPPTPENIERYLRWFSNAYNPKKIYGLSNVFAAAGSHHRLMWIHPFLDGNGRVGRLFTDNYMRCAGLSGYGLWSMSRGFGRDIDAYYGALAKADSPRKGDLDGRGMLSDEGLLEFTKYFIQVALDQVRYFTGLLEPQKLNDRIDIYFEMRSRGAFVSSSGMPLPSLHEGARDIYRKLLYNGPQQRIDLQNMLKVSEKTFKTILSQMKNDKLVFTPLKKPISLALSPNSIELLFPHLW